jgi:hypothetical protein
VTGVVVWLVVVVRAADVAVSVFFGDVAVVVVCVGVVDVLRLPVVRDFDLLWFVADVWAARTVSGVGLLVVKLVVVAGASAFWCFAALVVEPLPPHAARLSASTTTLAAATGYRSLNCEKRRRQGLRAIRQVM